MMLIYMEYGKKRRYANSSNSFIGAINTDGVDKINE